MGSFIPSAPCSTACSPDFQGSRSIVPKVGKLDLKDPLPDRWSRHELRARLSHDRYRDNRHSLMRTRRRPNIYNRIMIHNGSTPALSSALCRKSGRLRKVFWTSADERPSRCSRSLYAEASSVNFLEVVWSEYFYIYRRHECSESMWED